MEAALQKTLRDPEMLAEAEKSRLSLGPISGAQLRGMDMVLFEVSRARRSPRSEAT